MFPKRIRDSILIRTARDPVRAFFDVKALAIMMFQIFEGRRFDFKILVWWGSNAKKYFIAYLHTNQTLHFYLHHMFQIIPRSARLDQIIRLAAQTMSSNLFERKIKSWYKHLFLRCNLYVMGMKYSPFYINTQNFMLKIIFW